MRRDSIFFSITLFFGIAFISIITLFSLIIQLEYKTFYSNTFKKYDIANKIITIGTRHQEPLSQMKEQISSLNLTIVTDSKIFSSFEEVGVRYLESAKITIFKSGKRKFLKIDNPHISFVLEDLDPNIKLPIHLYVSLIFSIIILIVVYIFVIKKLRPLSHLREKIRKFGEGDMSVTTATESKGEIAEVANEFDLTIRKIKDMDSSRKLFLRNVMHELKTPLTKGRLSAEMLEDSKNKQRLIDVFSRIDILIDQFAKIEQLTSGYLELKKTTFRFIDILEHAIDLLMIDKTSIAITNRDLNLVVDFELFSIVVKNLIDNAIKYSKDKKASIEIKEKEILFTSKGEPLKKDLSFYTKPFSNDNTNNKSGMGLGLYITNEILKKHGFELVYEHKADENIFTIKIKSTSKDPLLISEEQIFAVV